MERIARFRVANDEVWFVQAVLTDVDGLAVVSLGERQEGSSVISVFYDDSAERDLAPLIAYLTSSGKMVATAQDEGQPGRGIGRF